MKQIIKSIMALLFVAMLAPTPANAQFGNLLKKANKVLEAITDDSQTTNQSQSTQTTTAAATNAVPIPSGGTMENPLSGVVDIELLGAYGEQTSTNYGTVYLVMKVKMIANKTQIDFGGAVGSAATMAIDQDGNTYKPDYFHTLKSYDVTEGIFMKIAHDDARHRFKDVKTTAQTMQVIRLGCWIDSNNKGMITFRDVPVQWNVKPE